MTGLFWRLIAVGLLCSVLLLAHLLADTRERLADVEGRLLLVCVQDECRTRLVDP